MGSKKRKKPRPANRRAVSPLQPKAARAEEAKEAEEAEEVIEGMAALAAAAPALGRLREVVSFVGTGRPATQAGNLKAADARLLATRLAPDERMPDEVRSMDDLPGAARDYRWAAAAGFLSWRGTKVTAGPAAGALEHDPLSAWIQATVTLLEQGLLDGFRQGWRKSYVELLDQGAPGLIISLAAAGGRARLSEIQDEGWEEVAVQYGYEPDDAGERAHVARLVSGMVGELVDLGIAHAGDGAGGGDHAGDHAGDQEVALTPLGTTLAAVLALSLDDEDDEDDLDLVDTDAQSLLLVCADEMGREEARVHLLAWCADRPGDEAAEELCDAMLDDDEPKVWDLGFEALSLIDPALARPAVRELRSDPRLRGRADAWLRRHRPKPAK